MSITSLIASKAYADAGAMKVNGGTDLGESANGAQGQGSFTNLVSGLLDDAVHTGKSGEAMAIQSLGKESDMIDVVTALSAAETTLETVIAVRDKVVAAYESIIRMPI